MHKEPWLTTGLKRCIDKNKKYYCKSLKNIKDSSARTHYLAYNTTLQKSLKLAKQEYHREKCLEYQKNTKKLWQLINKVSGHINDKSTTIDCITVNGIKQYQGTYIANSLASYFANVGKEFAGKIPNLSQSVKSYLEALQKNASNLYF